MFVTFENTVMYYIL